MAKKIHHRKKSADYTRVRADVDTVPEVIKQLEAEHISLGQKVAERLAQFVGSWQFILVQSSLFVLWIVFNVTAWLQHWDPYPFILLNLFLSFQAAYFGPIIMMAQNRKEARDRMRSELDFQVNIVAEKEIKRVLQAFKSSHISHVAKVEHRLKELLTLLKEKTK